MAFGGFGLFGCVQMLLGLHDTLLKASPGLALEARSNRPFFQSQARAMRGGAGGWRRLHARGHAVDAALVLEAAP